MGWIFLLALSLYPYTQDPAGPIKLWFTALCGFLALLVLIFGLAWEKRGGDWRNPVVAVMVFYICVGLVAGLSSAFPRNSLEDLGDQFFFVALAIATLHSVKNWKTLRPILWSALLALCLASLYGIVQWAGLDPFPWSQQDIEEYRGLPSTYANPNFAGHVLAPALAILLTLGLAGRMPWLLLPATLLAFHLYMTGMRGGPLALAAALLVVAGLGLVRRYGVHPGRALTAGLVAAILAAAIALPLGLARIGDSGQWFSADSALTLRMNGYMGASEMLRDAPLTGVGPGNYDRHAPAYWQPFEAEWYTLSGKRNFHVHNDLLEAAVEGGYPGALAYLLLLGVLILGGIQIAHRHHDARLRALGWGLSAAGLCILIDGQFGFPLATPVAGGLFFLLLGVVGGLLPQKAVGKPNAVLYWAGALPMLATAFLGLGMEHRSFGGERAYQEGLGAIAYAQEHPDGQGAEAAWEHGRTRLEAAARNMVTDPRPHERLGALLLDRGASAASATHYEASLRRHPHQPRALEGRAQALLRAADDSDNDELAAPLEAALASAKRAAELTPRAPGPHYLRGEIALRRAARSPDRGAEADENYRSALGHFAAARRYGYRHPAALYRAEALAHRGLGARESALEKCVAALAAQPEDRRSWELFETLAAELGSDDAHLSGLARIWQQALTTNASSAALARIGQAYSEKLTDGGGRPDLARAILETAVAHAPASLALWSALAKLAPKPATAVRWIQDVATSRVDPAAWPEIIEEIAVAPASDVAAYHPLGKLYLATDAPEQAATLLEEAVSRAEPELRKYMLVDFSAALSAHGETESALEVAREAQRLLPTRTAVEWNLARRLRDAGRTAEARFAYQTLLRRVPSGTVEHEAIRSELAALDGPGEAVAP